MSLIDLGPFPDAEGYEQAQELDATDRLKEHRSGFVITDPDLIYLDGNSLGRLPKSAIDVIDEVAHAQWGDRLIRSWNDGWWELQLKMGDLLAPLLGASPGEVMISDSTSVNMYKLADAAVSATERRKIVTDDLNFPTDVYILDGVAKRHSASLEIVDSDGVHGPLERLAEAIDHETALVSLSHTTFKSGYTYELREVTSLAHDAGAMVLWDCSHSVGAMPVELNAAEVDLAVGCTYKYLNGGPGSPAFLYVRSDLQDALDNPITAWWGHAEPFSFDLEFLPVGGIRRFHTGTMPILSLAAMEAGIKGLLGAGIDQVRAKSIALSEFLIDQWRTHLASHGFGLASPLDTERRGSHVSLSHDEAWPVTRAMIEQASVLPDFRAPDNIRLGLSSMYTTFTEVHTAIQRMKRIIDSGAHTAYVNVTATVT
jgi:kynureninase